VASQTEEERQLQMAMEQSMATAENENLRQMTDEELQAVVPGEGRGLAGGGEACCPNHRLYACV